MSGLRHPFLRFALAAVAVTMICTQALAAPRVALVVGNGGYDPANIVRLANPVNDARLMASALERVGFEVSLVTDAGQDAMRRAIKAFGKRLRGAGASAVGLFYYAGHGVEAGGSNYLIPIGAEVESAMDLQSDAVPAQWVLSRMEAAGNRLNMVILDACRNNPYAGRVRGGGRGLARMDAPSGSLIAYSAGPGQVADDGEGEHSPYTRALAEALVEPGVKVEEVFKRVRVRVEDETGRRGRRQTPWESSSLRGDFYFVAPPPAGGGAPGSGDGGAGAVTAGGPAVGSAAEVEYWKTIQAIEERAARIAALLDYKTRFPHGVYVGLADIQLEALRRRADAAEAASAVASATPPPSSVPVPAGPAPEEVEASLDLSRKEPVVPATPKELSSLVHRIPVPGNLPIPAGDQYGHPSNGSFTGHDASRYVGAYHEHNPHGFGTYTWADGDRYKGNFRRGKMHGRGTYTFPDGRVWSCEWRKNAIIAGSCEHDLSAAKTWKARDRVWNIELKMSGDYVVASIYNATVAGPLICRGEVGDAGEIDVWCRGEKWAKRKLVGTFPNLNLPNPGSGYQNAGGASFAFELDKIRSQRNN